MRIDVSVRREASQTLSTDSNATRVRRTQQMFRSHNTDTRRVQPHAALRRDRSAYDIDVSRELSFLLPLAIGRCHMLTVLCFGSLVDFSQKHKPYIHSENLRVLCCELCKTCLSTPHECMCTKNKYIKVSFTDMCCRG